jgi:hypothetical protein
VSIPFTPGALVVLYLHTPREKVWGVLRELGPAGVSLCGIDVGSFDDWLRGHTSPEASPIQPSVSFYPIGRVEKILLDEPGDPLGLQAQCAARTGRAARDLLEPAEHELGP